MRMRSTRAATRRLRAREAPEQEGEQEDQQDGGEQKDQREGDQLPELQAVDQADLALQQERREAQKAGQDAALQVILLFEEPGREKQREDDDQRQQAEAFEERKGQHIGDDDQDVPDAQVLEPARGVPGCPVERPAEDEEDEDRKNGQRF